MKKVHTPSSSILKPNRGPEAKVACPHECSKHPATHRPLPTNQSQKSFPVRLSYKQTSATEAEPKVFLLMSTIFVTCSHSYILYNFRSFFPATMEKRLELALNLYLALYTLVLVERN